LTILCFLRQKSEYYISNDVSLVAYESFVRNSPKRRVLNVHRISGFALGTFWLFNGRPGHSDPVIIIYKSTWSNKSGKTKNVSVVCFWSSRLAAPDLYTLNTAPFPYQSIIYIHIHNIHTGVCVWASKYKKSQKSDIASNIFIGLGRPTWMSF